MIDTRSLPTFVTALLLSATSCVGGDDSASVHPVDAAEEAQDAGTDRSHGTDGSDDVSSVDREVLHDATSDLVAEACPPMGSVDPDRPPTRLWSGDLPLRVDPFHESWGFWEASSLTAGPLGIAWVWNFWYHGPTQVGWYFLAHGASEPVGRTAVGPPAPAWELPRLPYFDYYVEFGTLRQVGDHVVGSSGWGTGIGTAEPWGKGVRGFSGMRVVAADDDAVYLGAAEPGIYRVVLPDGEPELLAGSKQAVGAPLVLVLNDGRATVQGLEHDEAGRASTHLGRLEGSAYRIVAPLEQKWRLVLVHEGTAWLHRAPPEEEVLSVVLTTGATEVTPGDVILGADDLYLYDFFRGDLRRRQHCSGEVQTIGRASSANVVLHEETVYFLSHTGSELFALSLPPP